MGRIVILPDAVADQIAAGEVVERPASVAKELVENALDAGATEVRIELEGGGRTLIAVSDDGTGMDRDDAVLALDRHATSKVRNAHDLVGVATYGFRGEALPAIASVSQFELESTARDGDGTEATRVRVAGGRLLGVDVSSRSAGTTVTVRRLFYNAPARRKFLRSQAAETRAVVQAVTLLALARLDVSFTVVSEGRTLVNAPRCSEVVDRLDALFGDGFANTLVPVSYAVGDLSVRGFAQRPADAKPAGRRAFLFVNGRPFRDPFLVRAAEAGYRATIDPGARPSLLLALGVPGDAVDVNVHPAKLEVRFRDRRFVERTVEEAIRMALGELGAAAVVRSYANLANKLEGHTGTPSDVEAADGSPVTTRDLFAGASTDPGPPAAPFTRDTARLDPLLQVFSTYIVWEAPDGLAFIDQHSAHERVLYEDTMRQLGSHGASAQHLLLPMQVDLRAEELEAFENHSDELRSVGFEADVFGGNSIVLHAVPNPHPRFNARRCFEELVADLARGRFGGWTNRLERFAATFACRAAIKAGQPLETHEMRALLTRLFSCELPPHDVHGRPTIVHLPRTELERRFGRG